MQSNYLVIKEENEDNKASSYPIQMLLHNKLVGVLPVKIQRINNEIYYYYDITSKQTLKTILETRQLSYKEIKEIVLDIMDTVESSREYLLDENDFVLDKDYIYISYADHKVYLCYKKGYQKSMREQIKEFMECLMNKVDYKENRAVILIYSLYKKSTEDCCTFQDLKIIIEDTGKEDLQESNTEQNIPDVIIQESKTNEAKKIEQYVPNHQESNQCHGTALKKIKSIDYNKNKLDSKISGEVKNKESILSHFIVCKSKDKKDDSRFQSSITEHIKSNRTDKMDKAVRRELQKKEKEKRNENEKGNEKEKKGEIKEKINKGTVKVSIPLMKEKLEEEVEIECYSIKTKLLVAVSILLTIMFFFIILYSGVLLNEIGNRLDMSKLIGVIIMLLSIEAYSVSKILSEKETQIVSRVEYVDQSDELYHNNSEKLMIKNAADPIKLIDVNTCDNSITYDSKISLSMETMKSNDMKNEYQDRKQNKYIHNIQRDDEYENESEETILLADLGTSEYRLVPIHNREYANIYLIEFPFFIGKLKTNIGYSIENSAVSRYHLKIEEEGETFYITDLNSRNGTFLNGNQLEPNIPYELYLGDEIGIANIIYQFSDSTNSHGKY
ncbi:DUF6382 domain-containing protein [Anaeromicropila herbilytica]|uniref:FHA domain-containing protein n=1 Tax=Anaeromicropila herbilytica TaxID=2785025 RepID=A0A7R7IF89_9FIRM|nr:DUF6382 domain-containing protein [Anaeromicropila herbilytica]BCN32929.1 hypothetical protein bsdtb5_42240 [Anaeromicropila herbilytica]